MAGGISRVKIKSTTTGDFDVYPIEATDSSTFTLKQTLQTGQTFVTFTSSVLNEYRFLDVYTSEPNFDYISIEVLSETSIRVYFEATNHDVDIILKVNK